MESIRNTAKTPETFLHRRGAIAVLAVFLAFGVGSFGCAGPTSPTPDTAAQTAELKNLRTFEDAHTVKFKLPCQACHLSRTAPSFLRVEAGVVEFAPTNDKVTVDRKVCFSCHLSSKPIFGNQLIKAGAAYGK